MSTPRQKQTLERQWWQTCRVDEFRARVSGMPIAEAESLLAEIKGSLSHVQATIETTPDGDQRFRARRALGFLSEKRGVLTALLTQRDAERRKDWKAEQLRLIDEAQRALDAGDVASSIRSLIEVIRGRL